MGIGIQRISLTLLLVAAMTSQGLARRTRITTGNVAVTPVTTDTPVCVNLFDGDGICDEDEFRVPNPSEYGTSMYLPDSDGDRYRDGYDATWFQSLAAAGNSILAPQLGNVQERPEDLPNRVDNADSQQNLNFFGNQDTGEFYSPLNSDVNRDGYLDSADSQLMLLFFGANIPYLPFVRPGP